MKLMGTIRKSGFQDCDAIYALVCDMENKVLHYEAFRQIYSAQLTSGNYTCLVFVEDGDVVGCLNLRMEAQLHHAGKVCEVMELAVREDCRGKGIGRQLFDAACSWARDNGGGQIELCCNRLRTRAHKFYASCGMHNFHYKFSLNFASPDDDTNVLGR